MARRKPTIADLRAFAVEIEVFPQEVAIAISSKVGMLLWSMGSGSGCDAQYLFTEDILGENRGQLSRQAKVYHNFAVEYDRLQTERIKDFEEFREDVTSGAFREMGQVVRMDPHEHIMFLQGVEK